MFLVTKNTMTLVYLRETRSKPHDFKGKLSRAIVRLRVLAY